MQVGDIEAVFESTENHFRKSFSVKSMCLAATKNRFSGKSFPFDQNFTLLTRESFYIVVLPSNDFRSTRKRERERATKRKNPREQNTLSTREREWSASIAIVITGTAPIGVDRDRDLTEKMWSFLGFICVFRNEWYYVFVW